MEDLMAQTVQEGTSNLRNLVVPPATATQGLRDMQEDVTGLVNSVVQSNLRVSQEFLRVIDPSAAFDLQRRFMREYLDTLMRGTAAFIRATRQVTQPYRSCTSRCGRRALGLGHQGRRGSSP
jgi:hypothetical protein